MHEKKIIHRDIKPENILLKNEKDLKICDFGCSTYLGKNEIFNPNIGTRNYKATELVLARNDYTQKIDIFSAACVIGELFRLELLFPANCDEMELFYHIAILGNLERDYLMKLKHLPKGVINYLKKIEIKKSVSFEEYINEDSVYEKEEVKKAADLLVNMLNYDDTKRFDADECLKHPFFL
jgi:serine/threonine protein kinase